MKITKSELKSMIREALREELTKSKRSIKEAVAKSASEIMRLYGDNVADHILELKHEKAFKDAKWFETKWYTLVDVKVHPDYYVLVMDRPVESLAHAELIINYAFDNMTTNFMDAMSDGGIVQDEDSVELYVERWVVE